MSNIDWREIAEFDGAEDTLALVFGRWEGEVADHRPNDPLEIQLCTWNGTQWMCTGGDFYTSWMRDVTHFALVQPPVI